MQVLLVTLMDLITKHKWTNESGSDVWNLLKAILPRKSDLGSFYIVEKILNAHMKRACVLVDCCINDCILFHNFQHPKLSGPEFQNAHRTHCHICGEKRWYSNKKPRKTVYYFPCKYYFQGTTN